MVKIEIENEGKKLSETYTEQILPFITEKVDELLVIREDKKNYTLKIFPQIGEDGGRPGFIATHGNQAHYINTKVILISERLPDTPAYANLTYGAVTISCFPNCCGKGIITAGNGRFGYKSTEDALTMMYLGLLMAKKSGYTSVTGIDVATSENIAIYKKANFKLIETTFRKNYSIYTDSVENATKNSTLETYTREIYNTNFEELLKELKSNLIIKEEKLITV